MTAFRMAAGGVAIAAALASVTLLLPAPRRLPAVPESIGAHQVRGLGGWGGPASGLGLLPGLGWGAPGVGILPGPGSWRVGAARIRTWRAARGGLRTAGAWGVLMLRAILGVGGLAAAVSLMAAAAASAQPGGPLIETTCNYAQIEAALQVEAPEASARLAGHPDAQAKVQQLLGLPIDERKQRVQSFLPIGTPT